MTPSSPAAQRCSYLEESDGRQKSCGAQFPNGPVDWPWSVQLLAHGSRSSRPAFPSFSRKRAPPRGQSSGVSNPIEQQRCWQSMTSNTRPQPFSWFPGSSALPSPGSPPSPLPVPTPPSPPHRSTGSDSRVPGRPEHPALAPPEVSQETQSDQCIRSRPGEAERAKSGKKERRQRRE
ncbi:hypothetical protein DPEC_G00123770 [Dallia pectoralis]|uniref:Uncharacterized protein n=1 Tax=Dallia pectoralis TaxID=75939 RepID=A0ACC2GRB4_DALPE|nr:hypothetical protein DPEC_G00123770 [Dallia pectoralis]